MPKKIDENKPFVVKATVLKYETDYGSIHFKVSVEGSGFVGSGDSISIGMAFETAYSDLMNKVSVAIFQETDNP